MMKTGPVAANPDAYVAGLDGWRREQVETLRAAVRCVEGLEEVIKWGHIVYLTNGPALLIRAEDHRVLLGFWRGQRLREIEARMKPGGKYEMASLILFEGDSVDPATVTDLARAALRLNADLGNPARAVPKAR